MVNVSLHKQKSTKLDALMEKSYAYFKDGVGALKEKSTDKLPFPFFPFWAHECLQSKVG